MRHQTLNTLLGTLITESCYKCKAPFAMSNSLYEAALAAKAGIKFYCPNGHQQHYIEGETEETKLRRERDRLQQRLAEKDDTIATLEKSNAATRGVVTRIKNRVSNGVCPCCNRTFSNLHNHMKNKHPAYKKDEAA